MTILSVCLLLLSASYAAAECNAVIGELTYSLSTLDQVYTLTPEDGYVYHFSLCTPLQNEQTLCNLLPDVAANYSSTVIACQEPDDESTGYLLGSGGATIWGGAPSWTYLNGDRNNGLQLTAANGQAGDAGELRTTYYKLICNSTSVADPVLDLTMAYEYTLIFITAQACPGNGKIVTASSGSGLSGGSIFLIIFFVSLATYFIVGALVMKFVYKAEGVQIVPNVEFWMALPALILDGCRFSYAKVASLCAGGGTYDTMKDTLH